TSLLRIRCRVFAQVIWRHLGHAPNPSLEHGVHRWPGQARPCRIESKAKADRGPRGSASCTAERSSKLSIEQRTNGTTMKYRKLAASDLDVSEISLGSWLTYGVGVERDKAAACVDRAFGLGINFIDTANVYGRGAAETFLGEVLAVRPRNSYVM